MWGYLTEFWEQLVAVGEYPIEWFEGIGNAVAGAIGGFFEDLIHHIYDLFYLVSWILDSLGNLFNIIMTPLIWVFNFGRGFISTAFATPEQLGLELLPSFTYGENIMDFFDSFPYFNVMIAGVGAGLSILMFSFIIKKLIHI